MVVAPVQEVGEKRLSANAKVTLAREISSVVGAAVVGSPRRANDALPASLARRAARQAGLSLVLLAPHLKGGSVLLEVTVTQFSPNFWERSKQPDGSVTYHGQTEAPADSLLRRFLPPGRGLLTIRHQVPSPIPTPVALLCADLQGDGGQQLLVVGRQELVLGRLGEREFLVESRRRWDELSPVAGAPLRAPLASAARIENRMFVGSSDRAQLVELDGRLEKRREAKGAYPLQNGRCLAFSSRGLLGREVDCFAAPSTSFGEEFDSWSVGSVTESNGTESELTAKLALGADRLELEVTRTAQGTEHLSVENAGHTSVWDDLDGDGQVELIVSGDGSEDGGDQEERSDQLRVFSLQEHSLELRASLAAPPVHALTTCPFSGSNPNLLVAAVGKELWVFR